MTNVDADPVLAEDIHEQAAPFISPLNMNGLAGRVLRAPAHASSKQEILLLYGHHARLERWWGLVQNLRRYGTVTMPDLPGFGGMDSFHDLGQAPSLDNFADYLAAFVRLRYKRRRITIVAISFGFVVATRMLQRYPELAKKVDILVSVVGFMHHDDFLMSSTNRQIARAASWFLGSRIVAPVVRYLALNGPVIRTIYVRMPVGKKRLSSMDPAAGRRQLDYDVMLWQTNDVRTHWRTTAELLSLNNCASKIDLPVWHVASINDHYFDNRIVEQHMLVVFRECHQALIGAKAHTPDLLADDKAMAVLLPKAVRQALRRLAD